MCLPFEIHSKFDKGDFVRLSNQKLAVIVDIKFNVFDKIYALKLTYVHLEVGEVIKEGIDAFVEGWNKGKEQ